MTGRTHEITPPRFVSIFASVGRLCDRAFVRGSAFTFLLSWTASQLSIKPTKYSIFARFPTRSDADLLLARGALELIFVRKNAKTTKSMSDAYFFDYRTGFIGNGDAILQ